MHHRLIRLFAALAWIVVSIASSPKGALARADGEKGGALSSGGVTKRLRAQARAMFAHFRAGDATAFVGFMDPNILRISGGQRRIADKISKGAAKMARTIEKIALGRVSPILREKDGTLSAAAPVMTSYRFPNGNRYRQKSYLVASSRDRGRSWKFLAWQCRKEQAKALRSWYPRLARKAKLSGCFFRKE